MIGPLSIIVRDAQLECAGLFHVGSVAPERSVDWWLLFDLPRRPPAQRSKRMDGRLPASLINLPAQITGEVDDEAYHSLAARDLQRGQAIGLPSGEAVARHLGVEQLDPADIGLARHGWRDETPLWFYILREAEVANGKLQGVGARIVAETFQRAMEGSQFSIVRDAAFRPSFGPNNTTFRMIDLLLFAANNNADEINPLGD